MPAGLGVWSDHQYLIASPAPLGQFALYRGYLGRHGGRSVLSPIAQPDSGGQLCRMIQTR